MAKTTAKHLFATPTKISLRVDDELHRRLKDAACESLQSVNAEAVLRLRESFERETMTA
jgi:predicted HicB family RNase H-like nuclease